MGKEMMDDDNQDTLDALAALVLWIQDVSDRLTAQESILREKLSISDAEWENALERAHAAFPLRSPQLEGLAAVTDFLKRASKPR
jgi:hypothetical protein